MSLALNGSQMSLVAVNNIARAQAATSRAVNGDSQESGDNSAITGTPKSATPTSYGVVNMTELAAMNAAHPPPEYRKRKLIPLLPGPGEPDEKENPAAVTHADSLKPQMPAVAPPPIATNFQGVDDINDGVIPPGTSGAVGPVHVMSATNSRIKILDKAGTVLATIPEDGVGGFWSPQLATPGSTIANPHVLYDPFSNRWIFTVIADPQDANSSACIAVSQNNDPTGSWNIFRFDVDATDTLWAEYPMLGFNKDWIVVSVNMRMIGSDVFSRGQIYALNKSNLYAGSNLGNFVFTNSAIPFSLQPAATYDNTLNTVFMIRHVSSAGGTERKSTLVGDAPGMPVLTIDTAVITSTLGGWSIPNGDFLPQAPEPTPGVGTRKIDIGIDPRPLNAVVRTIGTNTSLYFAQNITLPSGGSPDHAVAQWWEVDASSGTTTTVRQQGRLEDATATQSNGGFHFAYPGVAVNKFGDILIGCSRFSSNTFPTAAYAFHAGNDAAGTSSDAGVLKSGEGYYEKDMGTGVNFWGDYSAAVVDPANDVDFWTNQEYAAPPVGNGNGSGRWGTWWGRIVPPVGISGHLNYLDSATGVPNIVMTLTGNNGFVTRTTNTDSNGDYTFTNVPTGSNYTITPSRAAEVHDPSITAFDASQAARYSALLISLSNNQKIAGDSSNNGQVTAFDASQIARYQASIASSGSIAGSWKFIPASLSINNLTANQTSRNLTAILVGDITGNWMPNGTSEARVSSPERTTAMTVSLPAKQDRLGGPSIIPINVGNTTGAGIGSFAIDISFDQEVLRPQATPYDTAGTLSNGWLITPNTATPGHLILNGFSTKDMTGEGVMLKLKFDVVGGAGLTTRLAFVNFRFNEGTPTVTERSQRQRPRRYWPASVPGGGQHRSTG